MNTAGMKALLVLAALALVGCQASEKRTGSALQFPAAHRPVSKLGGNSVSTEGARDDRNEANTVMDLAKIRPGTTVADIGAGDGYYTIRLSQRVGKDGRVLAQDIDKAALDRLGQRVQRERLDNVSIKTGAVDDPRLPANSFDRVFMVHMYHEVAEPYAFLWRLSPALKKGGQIIVVDRDRPTDQHGIPPLLLQCEFQAVGYRMVEFVRKPEILGYYAQFEKDAGTRPEPAAILPCKITKGEVTIG